MLIHNYLHKICNAEGSSFEGLKYKGGPEFICPHCKWNGIWPYVSYPTVAEISTAKEMDTQQPDTKVYCKKCKHCYDIDIIMDPKVNVAIVFVYFNCLLIFFALNYIADCSFFVI